RIFATLSASPSRAVHVATTTYPMRVSSDGEADGVQLLAAAVGDVGRLPGRQPYPVDAEVVDVGRAGELGADLVLHDSGERAGGRGERHGDHGGVAVDADCSDESEVDDVD